MEMLLYISILLFTARIGGEIAERLRYPAIIGEIIAGMIIGPSYLGLIQPLSNLSDFLQFGGIFLLFFVGLSTKLDALKVDVKKAVVIAGAGGVVSFIFVMIASLMLGYSASSATFLGAIFSTTSAGIGIKTLADLHLLETQLGRFLLEINVFDDFVGVLTFATVSPVFDKNSVITLDKIYILVLSLVGFLTLSTTVLPKIVKSVLSLSRKMVGREAFISTSLILCFIIAIMANKIGIAITTGAFLAGVIMNHSISAKERESTEKELSNKIAVLAYGFFIPLFFANIGVNTSLGALSMNFFDFAFLLGAVLLGKMIGCGYTARKLYKTPIKDSFIIGSSMLPRGEFALITGYIGSLAGMITQMQFSLVVLVSTATCIISPLLIRAVECYPKAEKNVNLSPNLYTPAKNLKPATLSYFKEE